MGGHYGSVQLHTEDRQRVKQAAEQVARAKGIKCLIGPALNGWVGVYPENNGQDEKIGKEIARRAGGEAIHLLVHDDDIFAYWFWRDGKLIDSFWSKPGYFGDENLEAEEAMAGTPQVFAHLVGDRLEELRKLLDREEDYVFEYERLMQFGKVLGIRNVVSAYEYLKDGETDRVEQWKEFEEVPADKVRKRKPPRSPEIEVSNDEATKFRDSGLLLYEEFDQLRAPHACRTADGFLVVWSGNVGDDPGLRFENFSSPWAGPVDPKISIRGIVNSVASDCAGKRVALSLGKQIVVVEGPPWRTILEITESDWAARVGISFDGKVVAHSSHQETVVTDIDADRRLLSWGDRSYIFAFHPSGGWLVAGGRSLAIAELRPPFSLRHLSLRLLRTFLPAESAADGSNEEVTQRVPIPVRSVHFDRSGDEFICATDEEICFYRWEAVISAGGELPEPDRILRLPRAIIEQKGKKIVLSVPDVKVMTLDANGSVILGSVTGKISVVKPGTEVREIASMPSNAFDQLVLSPADVVLGVSGLNRGSDEIPPRRVWQIWSYGRLLKTAQLG